MMGLMEPNYLEGQTEVAKMMRALFIAGAIAVANARDGISDEEKNVIKKFMGESFSLSVLNIEKLIDTLPKRIELVKKKASVTSRMQVVRDLCVVARTEGQVTDNELLVIYGIADGLGLPRSLVSHVLEHETELD
jgi:tellurite resistance protein